MAKSRTKKVAKADAEAVVASMFDEGGEVLAEAAERLGEEVKADRLRVELDGPQPPPPERVERPGERAWESYPLIDAVCGECGGRTRYLGELRASCRRGHLSAVDASMAINAGVEPGFKNAIATVTGPSRIDVVGKRTGTGARVIFHERPTTRLEQYDVADLTLMNPGDGDLRDTFVKVTAALTPSERETFDGRAIKEALRSAGARAVLLAVHPVAEAPDREAKAEVAHALRPADAIASWFDALPVSEEDRAAAKDRALEILATEEGA